MFPQLNEYGPKFEGLPSKWLMHLKDDELLNEFGIVSDVDRRTVNGLACSAILHCIHYCCVLRYLLLQLARVREHERVAAHTIQSGVLAEEQEQEQDAKAELKRQRPPSIEMGKLRPAHSQASTGVC